LTGNFGEILMGYVDQSAVDSDNEVLPPFTLSARFIRLRDLARQDVHALMGESVPVGDVPLGACRSEDSLPSPRQEQIPEGSLELLDAGDLNLYVADGAYRIPSWNFPSVYGVVAGVAYGSDEPLEVQYRPAQEYRLEATGTSEIGPFSVALAAPDELGLLVVAGSEVGVEEPHLEKGVPLELRWEPGRVASRIVVVLSYEHFGGERRVLCRPREEGAVDIMPEFTNDLWSPGVSEIRLVLHRFREESFQAEGLDEGQLTFLVSTVIPLANP
jgi:hypothetical protein